MKKITKNPHYGNISIKKYCNIKKTISFLFIFTLFLGCVLINKQGVSAKVRELSTSLTQKSNSLYKTLVKNGAAVAYKVEIKKKTVIIHGSLSDSSTNETSNIGIHTYKLSKNVKYVVRGGEAPDQKLGKKDFKKYLKKSKNSGLGLVLEFKNFKVTKVAICS